MLFQIKMVPIAGYYYLCLVIPLRDRHIVLVYSFNVMFHIYRLNYGILFPVPSVFFSIVLEFSVPALSLGTCNS